jgi:signal transduction histidine kinase
VVAASRRRSIAAAFWSAVTGFAERCSTIHGLKVEVSLPKCISELNLDPMTQVQLLRIIQESLANVRRHAGVSSARLSFTRENGWLQVTVHDNGMGFDPLAAHGAEDGHYGPACAGAKRLEAILMSSAHRTRYDGVRVAPLAG